MKNLNIFTEGKRSWLGITATDNYLETTPTLPQKTRLVEELMDIFDNEEVQRTKSFRTEWREKSF